MIPVLFAAALAGTVALAPVPPVRRGIPAFPRLAAPADPAARRINAALARLDTRVRAAAHGCLDEGGGNPTDWQRRIEATMRGPDFLSFRITDEVDCGGAHPSEGHSAIVYDLATGAPVDWRALLGRRLAGTLALTQGEDEVNVVTLASPRLFALYRARYDHGDEDKEDDCPGVIAAESEGGPPPMLAWLDAGAGGLVLQFDLSHAQQACSEPVVLPVALLRREGVSPRLLAALTAAHAHR